MSFFNCTKPILCRKKNVNVLDYQDLEGLLKIRLQIGNKILFSNFYTCIDRACLVWGLICAIIFLTAQFSPISWVTQAIVWSILTLAGSILTIAITLFWVKIEKLRWVLYSWITLMVAGAILTDLGIFLGWGQILMNLCHLWLALCAVGYLCTGLGLRSRAFLISSLLHVVGIFLLPYCGEWQFLATGLLMAANLLVFAEVQWDMRSPIEYALLTEEQKAFNRKQHKLRQTIS
ncbi:MAG: hypothetical protein QNJ38_20970 [Prochloraceae cyanobacterium]|nr:hypothetical protein [Prochloraceae cyanobacterium]